VSGVVRNDGTAKIGALWDAFRSDDNRAKVDAEALEMVYCVYHDYTGGFMASYRMTIGYRISTPNVSADSVPEALHAAEIPAQRMMTFDAHGPQPQTVASTWQGIWASTLDRAFSSDYDVYDADDPNAVCVKVGVKSS
jgi:predicted transcriptional regulator YdeE